VEVEETEKEKEKAGSLQVMGEKLLHHRRAHAH
jgi:hypothetical protein